MKYTQVIKLSLIILLGIVFQASGQAPIFQWSKQYTTDNIGMQNATTRLASNSGFVVQSVEAIPNQPFGKRIYMTSFDTQSKVIGEAKMPLLKINGKEAIYLTTLEADNQLLIFTYLPVKGASNTLLVQVYEFGSSAVSEPKELVSMPIDKLSNSGDFLMAMSADKQTLGVIAHKPQIKKGKEQILFYLFDASLNEISHKEHALAYESKKAYHEKLYVTNSKTGLLIKTIGKYSKEPITTIIELKAETELKYNKLSLEDFYIVKSAITETTKGPMMLGFATDVWKKTVGTERKSKFAFLYDISNQKMLATHAWSDQVKKVFLGKGFTNLTLKDILVDQDNIYLIGDRYREEATLIPGKSFEYNYEYFNGPAVVVKFGLDGKVIYDSCYFYKERFKNQRQQKASFTPVLINGQLNFFASVDLANLSDKLINVFTRDYTLNRIQFDDLGNQTQTPIYNEIVGGKESSVDFCPSSLVPLDDTTFYIRAHGKHYQAFGKMTIK